MSMQPQAPLGRCVFCHDHVNAHRLCLQRYFQPQIDTPLQHRVNALSASLARLRSRPPTDQPAVGDENHDIQHHFPLGCPVELHGVLVKLYMPASSGKQDARNSMFDLRFGVQHPGAATYCFHWMRRCEASLRDSPFKPTSDNVDVALLSSSCQHNVRVYCRAVEETGLACSQHHIAKYRRTSKTKRLYGIRGKPVLFWCPHEFQLWIGPLHGDCTGTGSGGKHLVPVAASAVSRQQELASSGVRSSNVRYHRDDVADDADDDEQEEDMDEDEQADNSRHQHGDGQHWDSDSEQKTVPTGNPSSLQQRSSSIVDGLPWVPDSLELPSLSLSPPLSPSLAAQSLFATDSFSALNGLNSSPSQLAFASHAAQSDQPLQSQRLEAVVQRLRATQSAVEQAAQQLRGAMHEAKKAMYAAQSAMSEAEQVVQGVVNGH